MKYFKFVLCPLLAFFLGTFWVLHVKASSMPELSQATYQLIEGGNSQLFTSSFSSVDVFPSDLDNAKLSELIVNASGNPLLVGAQLNLVSTSDVSVRALTDSEISLNTDTYPYLYDINGNIVDWNNVYFAHYDNGFCHGELYVDSSGNILTSDNEQTLTLFQLGLGGKELGVDDLANIYDLISDQLNDQQMNIATTDIDLSDVNMTLYYVYGYVSGSTREAWRVYIPNAYDFGNTVATSWNYFPTNETSTPPSFLTRLQGRYNYDYIWNRAFNVTSNGYTYNCAYFLGLNLNQVSRINYSAFNSVGNGRYLMDYNGWSYSQAYADSLLNADIVSFKPLQLPSGSSKILQIDDTYSYNDISDLESTLNNLQPSTNASYDSSVDISASNYPVTYTYTSPSLSPSGLPFPDPSVQPTLSPSLQYDPAIQPESPSVENSFANFGIPFIDNLFTRYPFSIPWDIKNLISSLVVTPEAPAWNFDYTITVLGSDYTHHFEGDLSDFDRLAQLFRSLVLISFTVTLAIFSYKNHF